jgi:hypothetical protein
MYRRPKFLEILLEIREQMSRDSYFDADLFAEMVRSGKISDKQNKFSLNQEKKTKMKTKSKK